MLYTEKVTLLALYCGNTLLLGPAHYPHYNQILKSSIGDVMRMAGQKHVRVSIHNSYTLPLL